MPNSKKYLLSRKFLGRSLLILLGAFTLLLITIAQGPDQVLTFSREVPSVLSPERIDRNISAVSRWPQWFFSTAEVKVVSSPNQTSPVQNLQPGSILKLMIDPKKGERRKFELTAAVTEYSPGQKLTLKIMDDSSGRLNRLFDDVHWNIEFIPHGSGSKIRATSSAVTRHWRSRIFGRMAEKILLNQVFYPNILKLAELKQPFSVEPAVQPGLLSP